MRFPQIPHCLVSSGIMNWIESSRGKKSDGDGVTWKFLTVQYCYGDALHCCLYLQPIRNANTETEIESPWEDHAYALVKTNHHWHLLHLHTVCYHKQQPSCKKDVTFCVETDNKSKKNQESNNKQEK